jgi:hypothetical protein
MDQKEKHSTHSMHYGWMASRGNIGVHCAIVQLGIFGTWDPRPPDDGPLSTFPLDFYFFACFIWFFPRLANISRLARHWRSVGH